MLGIPLLNQRVSNASNREEWKKIAEEVTRETDPKKISDLVQELCDALEGSKPVEHQSAAD